MQSLRAEVGRIVTSKRQSQIIRQRSNDSSPLPAPPRQTVGQGRVPGDVGLRQFALLGGGHGTEIIVSHIKSSVEVQRSCPVTLLRDPFLQHLRRPSPLRKDQLGLKHTKRIRLLRRSAPLKNRICHRWRLPCTTLPVQTIAPFTSNISLLQAGDVSRFSDDPCLAIQENPH